jgi:hypothetical protein
MYEEASLLQTFFEDTMLQEAGCRLGQSNVQNKHCSSQVFCGLNKFWLSVGYPLLSGVASDGQERLPRKLLYNTA